MGLKTFLKKNTLGHYLSWCFCVSGRRTAVNWAKNALGVDEAAKIEAEIDAELALLITPTHGSGIPWTEGGI